MHRTKPDLLVWVKALPESSPSNLLRIWLLKEGCRWAVTA